VRGIEAVGSLEQPDIPGLLEILEGDVSREHRPHLTRDALNQRQACFDALAAPPPASTDAATAPAGFRQLPGKPQKRILLILLFDPGQVPQVLQPES